VSIAIKVENLTKIYPLYNKHVDRMKEALHPFRKKYHHDFHALKDVSFEIKKGETVGIIGKNGAGKSTLLKILTGVLTPTSGSVQINGRISSLLELGTGFNPELTGIENIYFNGTVNGIMKKEMDKKVDDIIAFADIGEFINQPVKTYSSGMFVRLAFACATAIDPDILIIDEALSVGDMVFQSKCMARMTSIMKGGVTVIYVSHDTYSVKTLCKKAILLEKGEMISYETVSITVNKYIAMLEMQSSEILQQLADNIDTSHNILPANNSKDTIPIVVSTLPKILDSSIAQRYGDGRGEILNAMILDDKFKPVQEIVTCKDYYVQIAIKFKADLPTFVCGFSFLSLNGVQQLSWNNAQDGVHFPSVKNGEKYIITTRINIPIQAGVYNFCIGLELPAIFNQKHQVLDTIMNFDVKKIVWEAPEKHFWSVFRSKGTYHLSKI
jgi:teichoic acid transport system ATP-binding protein